MIVFYSIVEKPLAHKTIQASTKSNPQVQDLHLEVTQSYMSLLGPFLPASTKIVKLYDYNGQPIKRKEWTDQIKNEASALKDTVPFQIGFFRNAIILVAIVGILALVMPVINKKNADLAQADQAEMTSRLNSLKAGDILRVSFYQTTGNTASSKIGLAKITRVEGDNIYFVRSTQTVENNFDNHSADLNIKDFTSTEEQAKKSNLDQYKVLVAPPAPNKMTGETIGSVLKVEN